MKKFQMTQKLAQPMPFHQSSVPQSFGDLSGSKSKRKASGPSQAHLSLPTFTLIQGYEDASRCLPSQPLNSITILILSFAFEAHLVTKLLRRLCVHSFLCAR